MGGPLLNLLDVQNTLAWDLLRQLRQEELVSKNNFLAGLPDIRLDAFENYVRGITAGAPDVPFGGAPSEMRLSSCSTTARSSCSRRNSSALAFLP